MTASATTPSPSLGVPPLSRRTADALADAATITRRNLLIWTRVPTILVFTFVQPVMFVLLFRYVFGGAIPVDNPGGYVQYLIPGIIAQTAGFASVTTAVGLAAELRKGVIDRYRSMPMARSAVLVGRLAADTVRMLITILVMLGVGYAVGFRFDNGVGPAVAMVALAVLFGLTMCCVSAFIGLALRDEESVQGFGLIWLFPLTFVSSAFVPIESMPDWLAAFAANQPVSLVIDAMRALAVGGSVMPELWQGLIWLAGILAVFGPLAVRAYRRAS